MKRYRQLTAVTVTLLVVSLSFSYASAAGWPPPKPKLITIATFDIGASTYAELAAIGEGIHKKFGVKIRNVPVGNSIARAIATRAGSTQIWGSCSAYYACAEGIFDFATREWGPQPIRALTMSKRTASFSPGTGKKSGIKTMADVKGKRVGWIVGNPTINMQLQAYLAFGGLTADDVELVKFPGYSASLRGLIFLDSHTE
jgi:TRAP transporter TAXI family solute receptor